MRILAIEDESKVANSIKEGLDSQGFNVDIAYDGYTGERLFLANNYDLVLLDVIVPGINGIAFCKKLKHVKPGTPILILSALGTTDDKVMGLEAGADDYMTKPFELRELVARLKTLTKRNHLSEGEQFLEVCDLRLDTNRKIALRGGKTIMLTAKEYLLLELLMENKGRIVTRLDIAERVWSLNFDTGTNVVEVYINILRKKIDRGFDKKLIRTRVGMGYIMDDESDE